MPADISFLKFSGDSEQDSGASIVFDDYLCEIANKQLRRYKTIIQYGAKQGQSYYSHVMDLVTLAEKLRPAIRLDEREMRCILLALTIHDLNKLPEYGKRADGREAKYNDAATPENIRAELEQLQADEFFPEWRDYLQDIVLLAHSHQEAATGSTLTLDQRVFDTCKLRPARLKGVLKHLMKAVDSADNSHSGDHCDPHEVHYGTNCCNISMPLCQSGNTASPVTGWRNCAGCSPTCYTTNWSPTFERSTVKMLASISSIIQRE
jgi:hypothetical protein